MKLTELLDAFREAERLHLESEWYMKTYLVISPKRQLERKEKADSLYKRLWKRLKELDDKNLDDMYDTLAMMGR